MALLLSFQLCAVPLVEPGNLVRFRVQVLSIRLVAFFLHLEPIDLALVELISQFLELLVPLEQLLVLAALLLVQLVDVDLVRMCRLLLLLLDLLHQLVDLGLQVLLELLLHGGVLLEVVGLLSDVGLELLTRLLGLLQVVLVLSHILLQVVEDLQFLVERDQCIELVLELLLLLLEQELELADTALLEHGVREALSLAFACHGRGGPLGGLVRARRSSLLGGSTLHDFGSLLVVLIKRFAYLTRLFLIIDSQAASKFNLYWQTQAIVNAKTLFISELS